jgi:Dynamin family
MPLFNDAQTRAILCGFLDIHRRMVELEALLTPGTKPTPFSGYVNDLSEKTVTRWQLVEFRPAIEMIVSRLESPSYEIAVFGRVSSGKSSLLNQIVGVDALPVGVTPVTAVPTRILLGDKPAAVISFAESGS